MILSPLVFWAASFVAIALLGLYISSKTIKIDVAKNGDLIVAMLTILGILVSVLLGLLVSSADEQYRSCEEHVNSESSSVNQVFNLSKGLPAPEASSIEHLCLNYCDAVVTEEWSTMKHGKMSDQASQIYAQLSNEIVQFKPRDAAQGNLHAALISADTDVGQDRARRILTSRSTWIRRLLPLVITCAIVVLACSYLYVGKGSLLLHAVLVGFVAITLGTNIGVIYLMSRPFASEWAIEPESFILHAEVMRRHMSLNKSVQ